MKILRIRALNINSLKGEMDINFIDFLKGNALFAITGETGSGKTTLLDIISCALYGRTPRLLNPKELMSRGTGEAMCEVEFKINKKIYRSSWSLRRARKKADGKFQTPKMELALVDSRKILVSGTKETPKEVENITGLDFGRFTQSMMLAQGSFDAFLKAKEKDRSALLEKITETKIYSEISKLTYNKYSQFKQNLEKENSILKGIDILEPEIHKNKEESLKTYQDKEVEIKEKLIVSENRLKWKIDANSLNREYEQNSKNFYKATSEKEQNRDKFDKLKLASKAIMLDTLYTKKIDIKEELLKKERELKNISNEIKSLINNVDKLGKEVSQSKIEYERDLEKYKIETQKIQKIKELKLNIDNKLKELNNLKDELKTKSDNKQKLEEEFNKIKDREKLLLKEIDEQKKNIENSHLEIKSLEKKLNKIDEKYKEIEDEIDSFDKKESKLIDKKRYLNEYIKLQKLLKDEIIKKEKLSKKIASNTELSEEIEENINNLENHIKTLNEKREQDILLKKYEEDRKKLEKGKPCFLCGATEHPYMEKHIKLSLDNTEKELKEKEKLKQESENRLLKVKEDISALKTNFENSNFEIAKIKKIIEEIEKYFEKEHSSINNQTKKEIEKIVSDIEVELSNIYSKRDKKKELRKKRDKLKDKLKNKQNKFENIKANLDKKNKIYQKEAILKKEKETKINTLIQDINKLQDKISIIKKDIETLQNRQISILNIADIDKYENEINKSLEDKRSLKINKKEEHSTLITTIEEKRKYHKDITNQLETFKKRLKDIEQNFTQELKIQDFESEENYLNARLSNRDREELENLCKKLEQNYNETKALMEDSKKRLNKHKEKNLINKEVEELENNIKEIKNSLETIQKEIGKITQELESDKINRLKFQDKLNSIKKLQKELDEWIKLNELIGSADGAKFSKFAQGITLDQLIYLANCHLEVLSQRYYIIRKEDKNHLLEFEIVDKYQADEIRPVNTLSGGESFLVSLSLALGLSELASQRVSIDSLFLDEGFGSLDKNSLETALEALNLLESKGKMVGVISHVEALKEYIPLQIRVEKIGGGVSSIKIING
ncbi:MAG: AAA family ATPase [Sulfurovaceae bacterium]|nr:AAA family ATPase [Sulfurovaceae bacterium]